MSPYFDPLSHQTLTGQGFQRKAYILFTYEEKLLLSKKSYNDVIGTQVRV